jgi:release factor glutamine methyltransferase
VRPRSARRDRFDCRGGSIGSCLLAADAHLAERGVVNARLDAEVLLAHVLGVDRLRLCLDSAHPLTDRSLERFARLVHRRGQREPLQKILGRQEFFSREFSVDASVLVPRPETEILVEEAVRLAASIERPWIVDVGAGSGAVAITLALELPQARVVATELSLAAIAVGQANAARLAVADRVEFRRGDLLAPCAGQRFDLVVSNPPYVPSADIARLEPEVRDHEPRLALDGGIDGYEVHRRLAAAVAEALESQGAAVVEIGCGQQPTVAEIFGRAGFVACAVRHDLAGIERVLTLRRGGLRGG